MKNSLLTKVTNIYIFIIIVIFPILVDNTGYFHILECKWSYFFIIFILYIFSLFVAFLYELKLKNRNVLKEIKFNKTQLLLSIYLIIIIISYILSPFKNTNNLIIGVGRGEGLLITSFYLISALLVSIFCKWKKEYLTYISISGIIVSLIGLLQYAGYNPFYLYKNGLGFHNCFYISTIGNIDTLSSIYCIYIPSAFISFIFFENTKKEKYLHLICLFLSLFMFGIINVDSGKVAILCSFIIIAPFIISNSKYLERLMNIFIVFLAGYGFNVFLNSKYYFEENRIIMHPTINSILILFLISIIIVIFLKKIISKREYNFSKKKIKKTYLLIAICLILFLIIIYFIKIDNKLISEIRLLLHGNFNDKIGSYRIFLWKRTLNLVKYYPVFGTGPDSFAILFMKYYTNDIMKIGPLTINDTAANVYLTILINYGIVGLFSYLLFIVSLVKNAIMKLEYKKKFLIMIIICYLIQDFFNLSVVIVSPILWLLIGIIMSNLGIEKKKIL